MEFGYYISDNYDPYFNLAVEQYLFKYCSKQKTILYFWQNENTIVIGHNQDMPTECKANEFLAGGGKIARRRSGGGAVYHDLGNMNYSIIFHKDNAESADYRRLIISALSSIGIEAAYNGRNDLLFGQRKISGTAEYIIGDIICRHGTLLINADVSKMQHYLTPDSEKLKRNAVSSVASRVLNLSEIVGGITVEKICTAVTGSTNALPLEISLSEDDETLSKLISFYSSKEWIYEGKILNRPS